MMVSAADVILSVAGTPDGVCCLPIALLVTADVTAADRGLFLPGLFLGFQPGF